MARSRFPAVAVCVLVAAGTLTAQQVIQSQTSAGLARDPNQARTQQIPIGTAVITGTVTAADTGEPIPNARVSLSGTSTMPAAGPGAGATGAVIVGRGGVPGVVATMVPTVNGLPVGPGLNRSVMTDPFGRFTIDNLPSGQFALSVSHELFLSGGYGQRAPTRPVTPFVLVDGQRFNASVRLSRGGVITGTVYGENGERLIRAQVRLLRYQWINGVRRPSGGNGAQTDDRGVYRIFGLTPGDYLVSAVPSSSQLMQADQVAIETAAFRDALTAAKADAARSGSPAPTRLVVPLANGPVGDSAPGFAPTYFPSSTNARGGSVIVVKAAEERAGVDIRIVPARAANVQGVVVGEVPAGTRVQVALINDDVEAETMTFFSTPGPDGKFAFRNVNPGQYTVLAQTTPAPRPGQVSPTGQITPQSQPQLDGSQRLWGRASITADGQTSPLVTLSLQPGRAISGFVVWQTTTQADVGQAVMVQLVNAPSAQPTPQPSPQPMASLGSDGRFTFSGVMPGRYTFRVNRGTTKSATSGGADTLDVPLVFTGDADVSDVVITITDRSSQLSGVVTSRPGVPAADTYILLFAAGRQYWTPGSRRILYVRPDATGRYTLRNMPAGDYLVVAVSDFEVGAQYDPELLRALAGSAERVTIGDGAQTVKDLKGM